jgi:hypothetical protein
MSSSETFVGDAVLAGGMSSFTAKNLDSYETLGTFSGNAGTATVHVPFIKLRLSGCGHAVCGTTQATDAEAIQFLHESDTDANGNKTGITPALPADTGLGSGFLATIGRAATTTSNLQVALRFSGVTG